MNQRTIAFAAASLALCATGTAHAQEHPHTAVHHATTRPAHASTAPSSAPAQTTAATESSSAAPATQESAAPAPTSESPAPASESSAPAQTTEASTETTETPAAAPTPPPPQPLPPVVLRAEPRPERWVATVLAVGSLGAAIAFGVQTLGDQSAFNSHPSQDGADATARDGMVTDIFIGLTLVSAAAAIVLWVAPNADSPRSVHASNHAPASFALRPNGLAVTF